jgi:hypothetical protein
VTDLWKAGEIWSSIRWEVTVTHTYTYISLVSLQISNVTTTERTKEGGYEYMNDEAVISN